MVNALWCCRCCSCWHWQLLLLLVTCVLHMLLGDGNAWCYHSCRRSSSPLLHWWVHNLLWSHWHRLTCRWYWHLLLRHSCVHHLLLLYQMLVLHNWMRHLLLGQVMLLLLIQMVL